MNQSRSFARRAMALVGAVAVLAVAAPVAAQSPAASTEAGANPYFETGAIPDSAEHGVTLVMDDASARAAGKLLASYGVPFLPERPGLAYLARIAPFVSGAGATPAEIAATYHKLVGIVRAEGGFGQHAVIVTRDARYLGEIPVTSW